MKTPASALAIVVGASLALAPMADAYEFVLASAAVVPNGILVPSSGYFVTQHASPGMENAYLETQYFSGGIFIGHNIAPTLGTDVWRFELDNLMASTWLALDPYGPKGLDGTASYGQGWYGFQSAPPRNGQPATNVHHPAFNSILGTEGAGLAVNGLYGDPVDGDGLSIGFFGDRAGFAWSAGIENSFDAFSESSVLLGAEQDSLFLGHFVLSDPGATIIGDDLLVSFRRSSPGPEAGKLVRLPLDGSPYAIAGVTLQLSFERTTFTNSLGTFTALDMYLVSSGTPIGAPPPATDDIPGDETQGDDGGDDQFDPGDVDPDAPSLPPNGSTDADDNGRTELRDIALVLSIPDLSPAYLVNVLRESGFDPARYSQAQWTTLMNGLYKHRIIPTLSRRPTSADRTAAIALLISAYNAGSTAAAMAIPDNGLPDANSSGDIDFADVALILHSGDEDTSRLELALSATGLHPDNFPKRGHWKKAVKIFYASEILPEFPGTRDKRAQKADRKLLIGLY